MSSRRRPLLFLAFLFEIYSEHTAELIEVDFLVARGVVLLDYFIKLVRVNRLVHLTKRSFDFLGCQLTVSVHIKLIEDGSDFLF